MSDIEKLIERLHQHERFAGNIVVEAADALTRLVAPLPAEVADAEYWLRIYCGEVQCDCVYMRTARLLESLARENARLAAENAEHIMYRAALATEAKELGDENDRLRAELNEIRTDAHAAPDEPLAAVVFDMRTRLLAALDGGRELAVSMARAQNEAAVLRAELDAIDQALLEEENYYANAGGDPAWLCSARDTLGALARVRAKLVPPPSGGEKAKCVCHRGPHAEHCPVHAR